MIYINDLPDNLSCTTYIYADDTSIYSSVDPAHPDNSTTLLQNDLNEVSTWADTWGLQFKASKSFDLTFTKTGERNYGSLFLGNNQIPTTKTHKHLGFVLDNNLTFNEHVDCLAKKVQKLINPLRPLSFRLKSCHLNTIYSSFIMPHYDYCAILYDSASKRALDHLERIHYNAALMVSGCIHGSSKKKVLNSLNWQTLSSRRKERQSVYMFKVSKGYVPVYITQMFVAYSDAPVRNLRHHRPYRVPAATSSKFRNSPTIKMVTLWNNTPVNRRNLPTLSRFKSKTCFNRSRMHSITTMMLKNLNRKEELCLNRLRVDLLLKGHLFAHNFVNITDPRCIYCNRNVTTTHFLLQCQKPDHRVLINDLLNSLVTLQVWDSFGAMTLKDKCHFLLYGDDSLNLKTNSDIIENTARFICQTYQDL